jgi:hypothetical protein
MPKCIAQTCFRQTVDRQMTCEQHWQELPLLVREEVRLAYVARSNDAEGSIEQWTTAKRRAIDALARQRVSTAAAR